VVIEEELKGYHRNIKDLSLDYYGLPAFDVVDVVNSEEDLPLFEWTELDLVRDKVYIIYICTYNARSTQVDVGCFVNSDFAAANYRNQNCKAEGVSTIGSYTSDPYFFPNFPGYTGGISQIGMMLDPAGIIRMNYQTGQGTTLEMYTGHIRTETAAPYENVTSIHIKCEQGAYMAAGTTIVLARGIG